MAAPNLHTLDDTELVARIRASKAGRNTSFPLLIQRHHADLLRRCRVRLGNVQDAEDTVQETVLRAYRALDGFKGEASFRTWLFAIADNQCNNLAQRRMRYVTGDHLRELIALVEESRHGEEMAADEASERVHETLAALPPTARDVLVLRFFRELSIEEIARTLGIGLSAAKMRLYRALDRFAACYGGERDVLAA